jgi:Uma2 family endonuclease
VVAVPEAVMRRRLTLADYESLPDDADYEIVDGILFIAPRARPGHQIVRGHLTAELAGWSRTTGEGEVVPDVDLIVDERCTYISPDIMYFAGHRFEEIDPNEMIRVIPDLVIEVLSPSTDTYDLTTKRQLYAELGVAHYWIADASRHHIRECVLSPNGKYAERVVAAPEAFEPALFPGLRIDLRRVFR